MPAHRAVHDFDSWRDAARDLLARGVAPDDVEWSDPRQPSLQGVADEVDAVGSRAPDDDAEATKAPRVAAAARVPRELIALLRHVAQHRDPVRWALMYRLLWRVRAYGRAALDAAADPDLRRAVELAKAVRRDIHKMHAYVRFREIGAAPGQPPRYVAWFEPDHLTLREGARFFARRFGNLRWMIVTPDGAARWEGGRLELMASPPRDSLPRADRLETLWRTYYRSICNAARIRPATMQREMPRRYWKNLPEAIEIPDLLRDSARRVERFDDRAGRPAAPRHAPIRSSSPAPVPRASDGLGAGSALRDALDACRRCPLWEHATQAVAGEGPQDARIVLVGEQPGDEEDVGGRPFVGPAGRLLDELLREAGIDRRAVYVTNAVKHFKWEPRGRRRLHKTPAQREADACRPWLVDELAALSPRVTVALGATAARALTGAAAPLARLRERSLASIDGHRLFVTYHPSALLRAPQAAARAMRRAMLDELAQARTAAQ